MNSYLNSEKKSDIMSATAYIVYDALACDYHQCECLSGTVLESMFLHYVEMKPKKMAQASERVERAMADCHIGNTRDLNAAVTIRRTKEQIIMTFDTFGFGKTTATVDARGNVKISP